MNTDIGEQGGGGDELVVALTPTQLGVMVAIAVVLILWLRARRRRTN